MPDSISKVAATRSLSFTPDDLSNEKTAAASVEPTIAPSSSASGQLRSNSHHAAAPVTPVHRITPPVASSIAGRSPVRKVVMSVRKPPSNKITAKATLPTTKLKRKLSNTSPPGPSTPASVPTTKNTSKNENPARAENTPARTLTNTNAAATKRGRVRKSSDKVIRRRYQKAA